MRENGVEARGTITGELAERRETPLRRVAPWIGHAARVALGLVFLMAGVLKMTDPAEFARQMSGYEIIGPGLSALAAPLIIAFEIALGIALIAGLRPSVSAPVAAGMLIGFIAVEAYGISIGRTEACGCFGAYVQRTPGQVIVEDLLFLGLALMAWFLLRTWQPRRARVILGVVIVSGIASLALTAASPYLPIDPWVTKLAEGRPVGDLGLPGDLPPMETGLHIVALFEVTAPGAADLVDRLNDLIARPGSPGLLALTPSSGEEATAFFWSAVPDFDIHPIDRPVLKRLYRRLPLYFVVDGGRVSGIHDDLGRATKDLLLSERL